MREELAAFIRENEASFYRLARSYVRNSDDALDMVHDAVVRAMEKCGTLRDPSVMKTWFYKILVNTCLMHLRRQKHELRGESFEADVPSDSGGLDDAIALRRAVAELSPKLRTVVILRFFHGMSLAEIAEATGANLSTVKTRLYRALDILKVELGAGFTE